MVDYQSVYRNNARAYDVMVRAEDCDGALEKALKQFLPKAGLTALEVGIGTGRLTELLIRNHCNVRGFEQAPEMLEIAKERLGRIDGGNWEIETGDARDLPLVDFTADLAVSAWVLGHMTEWDGNHWRQSVDLAISEMQRVVPRGPIIIFETLGTGAKQAGAPNAALAQYYEHLEGHYGFVKQVLRTDYQFKNVEQAAESTRFFFGDDFAEKVLENAWARIPEFTGMWVLAKP
ncbi:MAG: class I SAM-dependent methyltransferase [Planctomycetota bacterium]|nr:class I SAM-dependent methyltransferase [Planctomycetota bacterium]